MFPSGTTLSCLLIASALFCAPPAQAATWSYDNDGTGQEEWGYMAKDYAACAEGHEQSPIIIGEVIRKKLPPLVFDYVPSRASIHHDSNSLTVEFENGNILTDGDSDYELESMTLHTPSEHKVRDMFWMLEIELLHHTAKGKQLIVSVFANVGAPNKALQAVLDHPTGDTEFNPALLLPKVRDYYSYSGSLTTPPCEEGIEWRLLTHAITLSHDQLAQLGKLVGRNARLPQPVYMRTVTHSK